MVDAHLDQRKIKINLAFNVEVSRLVINYYINEVRITSNPIWKAANFAF